MRFWQNITVFLVLLALSIAIMFAAGKAVKSNPIHITFGQNPSRDVNLGEIYSLEVAWTNHDKRNGYDGSFVFTIEGSSSKVTADDLTFTFEGLVVDPTDSSDSLMYVLPQQTFAARESGVIEIEVAYNLPGRYLWGIRIQEAS